jgi:hypothetical protein
VSFFLKKQEGVLKGKRVAEITQTKAITRWLFIHDDKMTLEFGVSLNYKRFRSAANIRLHDCKDGGVLSKIQLFLHFQMLHDIRIMISITHILGSWALNFLTALCGH